MMILRLVTLLAVAACVGLLTSTCSSNKSKVLPIGPKVRADLVIYFKSPIDDEQVSQFGFLLGYLWARIYLMEEFQELG
jgi:hypothetical protein